MKPGLFFFVIFFNVTYSTERPDDHFIEWITCLQEGFVCMGKSVQSLKRRVSAQDARLTDRSAAVLCLVRHVKEMEKGLQAIEKKISALEAEFEKRNIQLQIFADQSQKDEEDEESDCRCSFQETSDGKRRRICSKDT